MLCVLNLALNARDAMPSGGTLRIETANVPAGAPGQPSDLDYGDFVRVSVIDNGTGISQDVLGKVFEPFFTTKRRARAPGSDCRRSMGWRSRSAARSRSRRASARVPP